VTCDVSINSLHLTDHDIGYFDSRMRLDPPLRQQRDSDALRQALADGTIDALVSDHTPVDEDAKTLPFAEAEPGATGLELLLALALKWGEETGAGLVRALAVLTHAPADWSKAESRTSACSIPRRPGWSRRAPCAARASTLPSQATN
jgi:dihydroorotase